MAEENPIILHKKWHQRWWGIILLVIIALLLVYGAALLYEAVFTVEDTIGQYQNMPLQTKENTVLRKAIETSDDPWFGNPNAKIVIVEFSDFQCPYCLEESSVIKRIRQEYADSVKIIYRDFPYIQEHLQSLSAAIAGECADEQGKFWPYHDLLFANVENLAPENLKQYAITAGLNSQQFNACLDSNKYKLEVLNDLSEGLTYGVGGTPTFFINGNKIAGTVSFEQFKKVIDGVLGAQSK